jgi:hypothetical protein
MSLMKVVVPRNLGMAADPPGTTGPDRQYVEVPESARLPDCDAPPSIVGGSENDPTDMA